MSTVAVLNMNKPSDKSGLVVRTPSLLKHNTHLFGKVNGRVFDLIGGGQGNPHKGSLDTELKSTKGPVNFPMHILSPIAIMGYPTFSYYQRGGYDLFKVSHGYKYKRELQFDCGGTMSTSHLIDREPDSLTGEFEVVDANLDCPNIVDIEPCVETFYPNGRGSIKSYFKIRWVTEDGERYSADVNSEYTLNHDLELPYPHFRLVNFESNHTDTALVQQERLMVLNNFSLLAEELGVH